MSRRRSAAVNNSAALLIFNIVDDTVLTKKRESLSWIKSAFKRASKLYKRNAVVKLNYVLLKWWMGEVRDDEVDAYIQDKVYKLDREAATLFYMLFKQYALSEHVSCAEKSNLLGNVFAVKNSHSNLTKYLL